MMRNMEQYSIAVFLVIVQIALTNCAPISSPQVTATPSSMSNKERNWLLTQKWLIDSINRLRSELNELARDYNQHMQTENYSAQHELKELIHDLASLRADHTVLADQQKQIIGLIKERQSPQSPQSPQSSKQSDQQDQQSDQNEIDAKRLVYSHHKHHKRRSSKLWKKEKLFEEQTKQNLSLISSEITALHDITVTLFEDLQSLDKKVNKGDESKENDESD